MDTKVAVHTEDIPIRKGEKAYLCRAHTFSDIRLKLMSKTNCQKK